MPKINNLAMHSFFSVIYYSALNEFQENKLHKKLINKVNMKKENLISHPKNL
jgi:hypothetical protein